MQYTVFNLDIEIKVLWICSNMNLCLKFIHRQNIHIQRKPYKITVNYNSKSIQLKN